MSRAPRFDPGPYRVSEATWNDLCTRNRELVLQRFSIRKGGWSVRHGSHGLTVRHGSDACSICGAYACDREVFEVRFENNIKGARLLVHARDTQDAREEARHLGAVAEVTSSTPHHSTQ